MWRGVINQWGSAYLWWFTIIQEEQSQWRFCKLKWIAYFAFWNFFGLLERLVLFHHQLTQKLQVKSSGERHHGEVSRLYRIKGGKLFKLLHALKSSSLQCNTNPTRSWKVPVATQTFLYNSSLQSVKYKIIANFALTSWTVNLNFLQYVMRNRCSCHLGTCMHADPYHSQSDDLNLKI